MDYLHAYWRMEYIETPRDSAPKETLFSRLPQMNDDRGTGIILRREHTYIVLNRFPYNAGHLLVVPFREVSSPELLPPEESQEFWDTVQYAKKLLDKTMKPDGFNIGMNLGTAAGAGVPRHLHCHVVPRWNGDTNFMPVVSKTRVLPQALEHLWDRLTAAIQSGI